MGHPLTKDKRGKKRKPVKFHWGDQQQKSFEELRDKLLSPPILAYANYKRPFKVHVDDSTAGLGAILYQAQEGEDRVIAYASRSLCNSERRYPANKLMHFLVCMKPQYFLKFSRQ